MPFWGLPLMKLAVPTVVVPEKNVTVPVGNAALVPVEMFAVKVMAPPGAMAAGLALTVDVVTPFATETVTGAASPGSRLASPT